MEAVRFGRGTWIGKMSVCWGQFGWKDVNVEVLKELSDVEVREVLEAITWRKVRKEWDQEMETKLKLEMLKSKVGRVVRVCRVVRRADRRLMMKLSGGTTGFQIETAGNGGGRPDRRECVRNVTVVKWKM